VPRGRPCGSRREKARTQALASARKRPPVRSGRHPSRCCLPWSGRKGLASPWRLRGPERSRGPPKL
jgi:hypothetical protein